MNGRIRPEGMSASQWHDFKRRHPEEAAKLRRNITDDGGIAEQQIRLLQAECSRLKQQAISHASVRREILGLAATAPPVPDWTVIPKPGRCIGVPTLFCSDWHWGEVVDPGQVGGVNAYNLEIAHARARACIQNAVELLKSHMVHPDFPGIVFALGGDMFSGDIHEELSRTNEAPVMPLVLDLYGVMVECVQSLAENFGRVFIPCVSGNHPRTTPKMTTKERNHLSFDWLLYCLLEKYFASNPDIHFLIPDGPDAIYRIHNHTYCLTHGDQFQGGDGMIGALGPIIRGDHRKRSRNGQVNLGYDTLLLGHWHQLIQMQRLIVNGSLVGYSEYAFVGNFPFEAPKQALWITHPEHGITFQMPVLVERGAPRPNTDWVSWKAS